MRVIAYVVSGIGFLGAGAIMKEGMNVRGLNTAATLWASAAVGSFAGADMVAQSIALTIFVLAGNTLLRPLVNAIDRIPLNERTSEATYQISITTNSTRSRRSARLPERTSGGRELPRARNQASCFTPTTMSKCPPCWCRAPPSSDDLDEIVADLSKLPGVSHATWNVSALE